MKHFYNFSHRLLSTFLTILQRAILAMVEANMDYLFFFPRLSESLTFFVISKDKL